MKKIRLKVDELCVESFTVATGNGETGTVKAYVPNSGQDSCGHTCDDPTCETLVCPCQVTQDMSNCVCPVSRPC
jgi:hypothetical protein